MPVFQLAGFFDKSYWCVTLTGELEKPHHQLVSTYSELNRQYANLLDEYKSLRRYFSVSAAVPYTDVWMHKPVQYYPGKHPCEKPAEMLRQIITSSSRPGDLVADFFMGSGSTIKAVLAMGRMALDVELESERFEHTAGEIVTLADN
ncbi:site-specific DNA-methyltransferase [Escherichia coli]|nr:site-specific DNA-methyltransferase [Escherichia coli]EHY8046712.1 site-specific DNA-methyltransferase [Escherichia coli O157]EET7398987.1 site-specific DNA-methyltransferase [Escherichia coli]EEU3141020.1 site-specific DNA-methyltransferase [Escherichia coli]EEW0823242.1 site-specific DNA-methyltransferase [Escherichia coli]